MKKIEISTEYIKLDQFLKFIGIADSGVHAKMMILEGEIKVNNEVALQRGKKLRDGDQVQRENGEVYTVVVKA